LLIRVLSAVKSTSAIFPIRLLFLRELVLAEIYSLIRRYNFIDIVLSIILKK
jgi:hypothetical protein